MVAVRRTFRGGGTSQRLAGAKLVISLVRVPLCRFDSNALLAEPPAKSLSLRERHHLGAYSIFFGVMAMETSLELFCGALFFLRLRANSYSVDCQTGALLGL